MVGVGAGLGQVVDYRARIASILRAEVVGDDLNSAQRILVAEEDLRTGN